MAEITNEMLYAEMLRLDERTQETLQSLQDLVGFMRETNRELSEGRVTTDALKKKLFRNRFDRDGAVFC